jgi:hypothetical protein
MFYERSDSLVGICKDVGTNSSLTLTLDLNKYDDKTMEEDKIQRGKKRTIRAIQSEGGARKRTLPPSSPDTQ